MYVDDVLIDDDRDGCTPSTDIERGHDMERLTAALVVLLVTAVVFTWEQAKVYRTRLFPRLRAADGTVMTVEAELVVGRDTLEHSCSGSHVVDPSSTPPRAVLRWDGVRLTVEDRSTDPATGTVVERRGRVQVVTRGVPEALSQGDVVIIGDQRLTVEIGVSE